MKVNLPYPLSWLARSVLSFAVYKILIIIFLYVVGSISTCLFFIAAASFPKLQTLLMNHKSVVDFFSVSYEFLLKTTSKDFSVYSRLLWEISFASLIEAGIRRYCYTLYVARKHL